MGDDFCVQLISVLERSLDSATSTLMILTLLIGTFIFTIIGFVQVRLCFQISIIDPLLCALVVRKKNQIVEYIGLLGITWLRQSVIHIG